jgi:hypothetical protein
MYEDRAYCIKKVTFLNKQFADKMIFTRKSKIFEAVIHKKKKKLEFFPFITLKETVPRAQTENTQRPDHMDKLKNPDEVSTVMI